MSGIDIRIARINSGLKQYEVAARVGVPQTILCEIETGKRAVSPELLKRVLAVFDDGHDKKELKSMNEKSCKRNGLTKWN